jgi:hypothetical protein
MLQKLRQNQKKISNFLFISTFPILISFVLMEYTLKPTIWINYLWVPILALGLLLFSVLIENNQLKYELSKK